MELRLTSTTFDADYAPAPHSRLTTNFANLSMGTQGRAERIAAAIACMEQRLHAALNEPEVMRFRLALEILTVWIRFQDGANDWFPMTETLRGQVYDRRDGQLCAELTGFNYSSYVRDYDFNIVLPRIRSGTATPEEHDSFGALHGLLYQLQFRRLHPAGVFLDPVVVAISVSNGRTYHRNASVHPILGTSYLPAHGASLTTRYFSRMGLHVLYSMPPGSRAPLAIYHERDDLVGRDPLSLAALVAVMDTFERIYRPEIYCARTPAGEVFTPDLGNPDHDPPPAAYDRVERDTTLGRRQAEFARDAFLEPNAAAIRQLMTDYGPVVEG
ncbi:MAG: putative oxygenase MesX [Pirellulales bacterium]